MKSLICENILTLLPKYIDNAVEKEEEITIEEHLCHCQDCFEKYLSLKNLSDKIKAAFDNINAADFQYEEKFFKNNISAYIDKELDKIDYFTFDCYVAKSQKAKEAIDSMKHFEETLKHNIEKNKNILKNDLSKKIVEEYKKDSPDYLYNLYIKAAFVTAAFIILTICAGYLSFPGNINKITNAATQIFMQF